MSLKDLAGALRAPPAPRIVPFLLIKRKKVRVARDYGHWWIEMDGAESYGWWPSRCPVRLRHVLRGTKGTLNGVGSSCYGGGIITDPHHGELGDYRFHPILTVRKSDRRLRAEIRAFAHAYRGEWRWSTKPTDNCRMFQLRLLQAVGLEEGAENLASRGYGCPFLHLLRRTGSTVSRLQTAS